MKQKNPDLMRIPELETPDERIRKLITCIEGLVTITENQDEIIRQLENRIMSLERKVNRG